MKYFKFIIFILLAVSKISYSQEVKKPTRYKYHFDPDADARAQLNTTIEKAKKAHKTIFVLVGGDWDAWSRKADDLLANNDILLNCFIYAKINFSPSNKNYDLLRELGCPRDQGYPVILILDENGKPLSAKPCEDFKLLPSDYDIDGMQAFISQWCKLK